MTTELKIHSDKAWEIASHWSDVLASDTRTLAAAIDVALAEAREALGKAEAYIPTETVECHGDKCRQLWCVSCFGEEEAEREIERATLLAEEIRAMKEKP